MCEIRDGLITIDHVKMIALEMGHGVHGTYNESILKSDLEFTFRRMLDTWWRRFLHDPGNDGKQRLFQILNVVGLEEQAFKLKLNSKSSDDVLNSSLTER